MEFVDPRSRAKAAVICLAVVVVALLGDIAMVAFQIDLLRGFFTEEMAAINDQRVQASTAIYALAMLLSIIFFSRWLLVSNRNARYIARRRNPGRRRERLRVVGGWTVGWYFIPIANLWKPYQSMKEMCEVSRVPLGLVTVWWILWILCNFIGRFSGRMYEEAETVDALVLASYVDIATSVLTLLAAVAAIVVVRRLTAAQVAEEPEDEAL